MFQVVTFASSVQTFFESPQRATPENLEAARKRVDAVQAMGGTNIGDALRQALEAQCRCRRDDGPWLPQVVFVTDGQPTVGLTNPKHILELTRLVDKQADARVCARRRRRDRRAAARRPRAAAPRRARLRAQQGEDRGQGRRTVPEDRPAGADRRRGALRRPRRVRRAPNRTRDLFCGEMLQVVGRYRDSGNAARCASSGKQNGVAKEFVFRSTSRRLAEQHTFVPTLWARQHVASLLDAIRRNGQQRSSSTR
jgi:hypothetical protein